MLDGEGAYCFQILAGEDATRRIGGAVDDQELRLRRDQCRQLVDVEAKVEAPRGSEGE